MSRFKLALVAAVGWIVALAGASSHGKAAGGARTAGHQCQLVADAFTTANLGPASIVPNKPIHDPALDVCYKASTSGDRRSCCTQTMEKHFLQHAEQDFYFVIKSTGSALKDTLTANAEYYHNEFSGMLSQAENQTDVMLGEVFKIPGTERHLLLTQVFSRLQHYISHSRGGVSVRDTVDAFFDQLFPLVFHNLLNDPSVTNLDADYRECLTEIRQSLTPRPFGDIPHRLAHTLTQSMLSAKMFLEGLNTGIDAINRTEGIMLEPQCISALARMRYCGQCGGHIGSRPCRAFCYNVMRGCLATTAEIDRHWNEYVDSVKVLTTYMQASYNMEEVLHGMHTRVSEAIMHSMETGHKFYARLVTKCGHPKASRRSRTSASIHSLEAGKAMSEAGSRASSTLMGGRMDTFMRSLMASKGFYRNLADSLCSHEKFATGFADQDHCWNGEALARYNKTLVPVDLVVQMSENPEMEVTARRSNSIVTLIDKLIHVKKLINSKIAREMMQADGGRKASERSRNRDRYKYGGYSGDGGSDQRDDEDMNDGRYGYTGYSGDGSHPQRDDEDWEGSGSGGGSHDTSPWYAGSGSGPSYNHPQIKPRGRPSSAQDPDIYIDEPSQEPPTYKVTRQPPRNAGNQDSAASCLPSSTLLMTSLIVLTSYMTSFMTFTGLSLRFNG